MDIGESGVIVEAANVLRHLQTTVLNYGEAIVTSAFKDLKKKKS